ncbi:acid-sensing ion channel 1A-like [Antedon mediterranea]|uniref:acid-sensing ion channel 1A-like n=1 Tax=Antedon mediterranea TaxID=105859 RepID=UPI003AF9EB1D
MKVKPENKIEQDEIFPPNDRLQIFGENTSIHGIRNITNGNRWTRRLVWTVVLCVSFVTLTYQVYSSVNMYFEFETNTKFQQKYRGPQEFPNVVICNSNMLRSPSVMTDFGGLLNYYQYGLLYLKTLFPSVSFIKESHELPLEFEDEFPGGGDVKTFIERSGHRIDSMLRVCYFNGEPCTADDFEKMITNYGLCYRFVPPTSNLINGTGTTYGLSLILNVEKYDFYSAPRENIGFRISVASKHDIPDLQSSGIDVSTGTQTQITIRKSKVVNLPKPYGECIEEGARSLRYLSEPYSQNKCLMECESEFMVQNCSCRNYYLPGGQNTPFCSPKQISECYLHSYTHFLSMRNNICDCPEECIQEVYKTSMSFSAYPSRGVADIMRVADDIDMIILALGCSISKHSSYDLYNKDTGYGTDNLLYFYVLNTTRDAMNTVKPAEYQVGHSDLLKWSCTSLFEYVLYEFVYSIKYIVSSQLLNQMYTGYVYKTDPQYSTEYNSLIYFEIKNTTEYYIGEFGLDVKVQSELNKCGAQIDDPEGWNNTMGEQVYDYMFDVIYKDQYVYINDLFVNKLEVLIKEYDSLELATEFIRDNFARVQIYFETLKVEELIDQPKYKLFSLICDFGGALGLFFGASIMAIFETLDFWLIQGYKRKKPTVEVIAT